MMAGQSDPSDAATEWVETYLDRRRRGAVDRTAFLAGVPADERDEVASLIAAIDGLEEIGAASRVGPPQVPERLGEYRILRLIGAGGMGMVYEAEQAGLDRRVAVKVLAPALAADARTRERFAVEATTAARLQHEHIVPILANGQDGAWCWYAMALVDGVSLDVLAGPGARGDQPFTCPLLALPRERFVAEIGRQAAEALACAHRQQVLHRDVKPANILLDRQGRVLLADFGLATALDAVGLEAGVSQLRVGTLRFTAPERLTARGGAAADQYSLGITLYELAAGRPAFPQRESVALAAAIIAGGIPRLVGVPGDLATIIATAIATDPTRRYPSLEAMRDDLERFLNHRPILARPTSVPVRIWLWMRRNPGLAAAVLVLVLVVIGFQAALLASQASLRRAVVDEQRQRARADDQATIAAEALDRLFNDFPALPTLDGEGGSQPVSPVQARLLESLLPQFEALAIDATSGVDGRRRLARAHLVLGHCRWRLGDAAGALPHYEKARALLAGLDAAAAVDMADNLRAAALQDCGRGEEARAIWREVALAGQSSADRARREQAFAALIWLLNPQRSLPGQGRRQPVEQDPELVDRAVALVIGLWQADARLDRVRFALATLLGAVPRTAAALKTAGLPTDRRELLHDLVEAHPDQLRYRLELARCEGQVNLHDQIDATDLAALDRAVAHADILITRWPSEAEAVRAAIDLYDKQAAGRMRAGDAAAALRGLGRAEYLMGMVDPGAQTVPAVRLHVARLRLRRAEIQSTAGEAAAAATALEALIRDLDVLKPLLPERDAAIAEDLRLRCQEVLERARRRPGETRAPRPR